MGAYTEWPYANWHELNLDWLLMRVKELYAKSGNLEKAIAELHEELDNFINNPEVVNIIRDKIQELADSGQLDDLFMYEVDGPIDTRFMKSSKFDGFKVLDDITLDLTNLSIDTVKVMGKSLRDIFITEAMLVGGNFEDGVPTLKGQTSSNLFGGADISPDDHYLGEVSLKCMPIPSNKRGAGVAFAGARFNLGNMYFGAFKCKVVDFYERTVFNKSEGCTWGFYNMPYTNTPPNQYTYFPRSKTYGTWQTYSEYINCDIQAPPSPGIGVVANYGYDYELYIDNAVFLDLNQVFGVDIPSQDTMVFAYDLFSELLRGSENIKVNLDNNALSEDYSNEAGFEYFINLMNRKAQEIGLENATIISSAGGLIQEGRYDTSTVMDMAKWGLLAFSNPKLQRYLMQPFARIDIFRGRTSTKYIENGYISNQYDPNGPVLRFPIMKAKGGSLPDSSSGRVGDLRNVCCYGSLEDNMTYLVAIMGLNSTDQTYNAIMGGAFYIRALVKGNDPTDPEYNPFYSYLDELINRADDPIEICAMGFINGSIDEAYAIMPWSKLRNQVIVWNSPNAETDIIKTASTMKLLTASLVVDLVPDLQEMVHIKEYDIVPGSGNTIQAGDYISVDTLLQLMLIESCNDSATALARFVGDKLLSNR